MTCIRNGCNKPSHNGKSGYYCSFSCRDKIIYPKCIRIGCNNDSFNGKTNEYCSFRCRDMPSSIQTNNNSYRNRSSSSSIQTNNNSYRNMSSSLTNANNNSYRNRSSSSIQIRNSINDEVKIYITDEGSCILFYYPGRFTKVDNYFNGIFLANFFEDVECPIIIQYSSRSEKLIYKNVEAAFQASKFTHHPRFNEFKNCSGSEAFRLKKDLSGYEDYSYGGLGNQYNKTNNSRLANYFAMRYCLTQKFKYSKLIEKLLETRDAFLCEHNEKIGRDNEWSDNNDGSGKNLLGLLLMLERNRLMNNSQNGLLIYYGIDVENEYIGDNKLWQYYVKKFSDISTELE